MGGPLGSLCRAVERVQVLNPDIVTSKEELPSSVLQKSWIHFQSLSIQSNFISERRDFLSGGYWNLFFSLSYKVLLKHFSHLILCFIKVPCLCWAQKAFVRPSLLEFSFLSVDSRYRKLFFLYRTLLLQLC